MDLLSLKTSLETLNPRRLLKPKTLEHLVLGAKILFTLLTLVVVAFGAQLVTSTQDQFASRLEDFEKKIDLSNVNQAPTTHSPKLRDPQSIQLSKLFGPIGVPTSTSNTQKPAESSLPLSLIGVFLPDQEEPYAIIQDDKKNLQDVFSPKESIFGAATLLSIFPDRVEIDRNGTKEVLVMDSNANSKGGDSAVSGATSENEFVVAEEELDKALENLPLLLTQARAVPYFKDGKAVGLRLFAIRTGSLFEKIGLQNGDVLKSVNGNSLADLSQAMQLFQKLKEERSIDLALERNMVEKQFKYQIR